MANEISTSNKISDVLFEKLEEMKEALPADFNTRKYTLNCVSLLNQNDNLAEFSRNVKNGNAQIIAGFERGALLGLDAIQDEMYLIPYGSKLQFMPSYKGMAKMAKKYSQRPINEIYAKLVHDVDDFSLEIIDGKQKVYYKPNEPFKKHEVIGVFAVCEYKDGGMIVEMMSSDDVEVCRKHSKAQNSPAWSKHWGEMAKKTVLRRLCKNISLDMDAYAKSAFEAGTEMETDVQELAKREIAENENSDPFIIDGEAEVIE